MIKIITDILWSIAIVFLLGGGLYFSIKLGFPQLKIKSLFKGFQGDKKSSVSPFKSLTMSLAARVGVGSLAGIALAIYIGGPGTIFWIWLTGIITSINSFCESYLGVKYQEKDENAYKGGPSFYIEKGLKNKKLASLYSILIIIAYIVGFMTIQANTITTSIHNYYKIDPIIIGVVLCVISFLSIMKGLDRIVSITSKLVPLMGIGYVILSIIIIALNINLMPSVLLEIITSAFNSKAITGGIISTFIIGIQRGIFSTESGLGTGSIASSCSHTNDKISLGLIQILGIYFTVFIVCTSTALLILTSDYTTVNFNHMNGIELTQYALDYHLGKIGIIVLMLSVISLAYSTIVAGYYYGESSLKYLIKNASRTQINILKTVTIILLMIGSVISATLLWNIVDILVAMLSIINMYALLRLRKEIILDYKNRKNKQLHLVKL